MLGEITKALVGAIIFITKLEIKKNVIEMAHRLVLESTTR
jgi:hypothetical protein